MTIALIAHDSKKELMVQFCTAYCRILSQHKLVATGTTGKLISEATGLQVQRFLAGIQGGDQQIASRIACNEIDLLLFFRDPINAKPSEPNEMTLLRLCDVHNIPMATNIATAEVLIHGLERGDLDWRDIVNPQKKDIFCAGGRRRIPLKPKARVKQKLHPHGRAKRLGADRVQLFVCYIKLNVIIRPDYPSSTKRIRTGL